MELWKVKVEKNNVCLFYAQGKTAGIALGKVLAKLRLKGMVR